MSASEKLKALTTFDYLGPDSNDMDGEAWGDSVDTAALARALPQIVAVVEAAELATHANHTDWSTLKIERVTTSALAALDEALS